MIPNPGPLEHLGLDIKQLVNLHTYDGFRCDINKQLSPYMAVVHSFSLGQQSSPDGRTRSYSFVTQVADENMLLMARVDPERGTVDGRIHRSLLGGMMMGKLQIGVSSEGQSDQCLAELDINGATWTSNLKYGTMGGGLVWGCNYLQGITERLAMGGEGMYIAANQTLVSSYSLKYSIPASSGDDDEAESSSSAVSMETPSTLVCNYNSAQGTMALDYKRVVTPNRVTLGAELQFQPGSWESQVLLGAEFQLTRSKVAVAVDGSGKIQSQVDASLGMAVGSPTLKLSADIDHVNDTMRFGYGIDISG
jgi:mitochondrial import receptor subunit TOM40